MPRSRPLQITLRDIAFVLPALRGAGWPLFREPFDAWYRMGDHEGGSREFLVLYP